MKILFFAGVFFFSLFSNATAPREISFNKSIGVWRNIGVACVGEEAKILALEAGEMFLIRIDANTATYSNVYVDSCRAITKANILKTTPLSFNGEGEVVEATVLLDAPISHSENCPNQTHRKGEAGELLTLKIKRDDKDKDVLQLESKTEDVICPKTKHYISTNEFYEPVKQATAGGASVFGDNITPPVSDTDGG